MSETNSRVFSVKIKLICINMENLYFKKIKYTANKPDNDKTITFYLFLNHVPENLLNIKRL